MTPPAPPRRRALLLLAALPPALGGCGIFGRRRAGPPPEEDTPAHRACRAEARVAPEVRALDRQVNPQGGTSFEGRVDREKAAAEARAYRDCLRRTGLGDPGGVEPIVPRP